MCWLMSWPYTSAEVRARPMEQRNAAANRAAKRRSASGSGAEGRIGRFMRAMRQCSMRWPRPAWRAVCGSISVPPSTRNWACWRSSAKKRKRASGPRVLIIPGIMGSRLGGSNRRGIRPLGIGIVDRSLQIASGRLTDLKLPSAKPIRPMGALLFSYAKLKLRLDIADSMPSSFRTIGALESTSSGRRLPHASPRTANPPC